MVVAVVLLIVATVFWIYFLWSRRKFYRIALKIPGPMGLPFFGIVHKVLNMADVLYELPKLVSSYNSDTLYSWLGPIPVLYTVEPEVVEVVLNHPDCINKSIIYDVINEAMGSGLLTSKSPTWNNHRKLMNPAFSHMKSMRFIPSFNKLAHELCDRLEETINKGEVDVKRYIYNMGFKSAIKNIFGVDIEDETNAKMIGYWDILLYTGSNRAVKPWLRPHAIFSLSNMYKPFFDSVNVLKEFVYTSVSKRFSFEEKTNNADTTKAGEKRNNVIIDQAIKAFKINEFTFDDIVDEGHILTFASFETSASTIYTTLMSLAMHPEYQERVFQEIISVFPDKDFDVKYEDFDNLVYLEMCINEALRTAPAIPLIARDTLNDIQIRKDVIIPKGTQIIVDLFNLQRNESVWGPNANCFDPDHFLPQNVKDRHRCAFAPFSKGRRNCAGWQYAGMFLKVSLALILRKYRFSTTFKYEDLKYVFNINLRYGVWPNLEVNRR